MAKEKAQLKVHTIINTDEKVPNLVRFSPATTHEHHFLNKLKCDKNTIYIFDKGYNDYKAFKHFTDNQTGFVTRIKNNANYEIVTVKEVSEEIHSAVLSDKIIEIGVGKEKQPKS